MDGVIRAGLYAGPEAEAAVSTFKRAAGDLGCGDTVGYAVVLELALGVDAAAAADMGGHFCDRLGLDTHDGGNGLGAFGAADRAGVDVGLALEYGGGKGGAAGVSAASAVRAGKGLDYLGLALILVDMEYL